MASASHARREGVGQVPPRQPARPSVGRQPSLAQELGWLALKVALAAAGLVTLFTLVFGLYRVGDQSMKPALRDGDLVMYYRLDRSYQAQDVVVLGYEGSTTAGRVVAVAGDTVDIDSRGLVVNGSLQQERDVVGETTQVADGVTFPLTVPQGCVFLLGDNRPAAVDSRIYGCVPTDQTYGQVMGMFRRRGF